MIIQAVNSHSKALLSQPNDDSSGDAILMQDITELFIKLAEASHKGRINDHELMRLYANRQFTEQGSSASYLKRSASVMLLFALIGASCSVAGTVIAHNAPVATGLYGFLPGQAKALFGPTAAAFGAMGGSLGQAGSQLSSELSRASSALFESWKTGSDSEAQKSQQMFDLARGDRTGNEEARRQALQDAQRLLELELATKRSLLGR